MRTSQVGIPKLRLTQWLAIFEPKQTDIGVGAAGVSPNRVNKETNGSDVVEPERGNIACLKVGRRFHDRLELLGLRLLSQQPFAELGKMLFPLIDHRFRVVLPSAKIVARINNGDGSVTNTVYKAAELALSGGQGEPEDVGVFRISENIRRLSDQAVRG